MELEQHQTQIQSIEQRLETIKQSLGVIEWHVKADLVYEYHCIRFKQQAEKLKVWSKSDTARELGLAVSSTTENCMLAEGLKDHEGLRNLSRLGALEYLRKRS